MNDFDNNEYYQDEGYYDDLEQQYYEEHQDFDDEWDYDDSMDGDAASALASAGWGTDEDYGYTADELAEEF